jgi:hypothetical protein
LSQGQNVTVDVLIGSKCHCGRSELGRFVQASFKLVPVKFGRDSVGFGQLELVLCDLTQIALLGECPLKDIDKFLHLFVKSDPAGPPSPPPSWSLCPHRVSGPEADLLVINTPSYLRLSGGFCWGVPKCHLLVAASGYPGFASTRR